MKIYSTLIYLSQILDDQIVASSYTQAYETTPVYNYRNIDGLPEDLSNLRDDDSQTCTENGYGPNSETYFLTLPQSQYITGVTLTGGPGKTQEYLLILY